MIKNVLSCIFAAVGYWWTCRLFATYDHKCLTRKLYVKVKNKYLWLLLGVRYRGSREMPEEDWYKLNILGLSTYILLLPILLTFYAARLNIYNIYIEDVRSARALMTCSLTIILLNALDEILGNIFYK